MHPYINFWQYNNSIPVCWQPNWEGESDKLKNQTYYFFATDSKENFKNTRKPNYTETSITYYFNEYGYRCDFNEPWDLTNTSKTRIMTLGCSHTVGVGIRWENTWSSIIQKNIPNSQLFNLAVTNGSSDTVARLLYQSVTIIKPNIVCILWPEHMRYENFNQRITTVDQDIHPWPGQINHVWMNEYEIMSQDHFQNLQEKNCVIVSLLKKIYSFQLIQKFWVEEQDKWLKNYPDLPYGFDSRDYHPGITFNKRLAEDYLNEIIR